jgi:hypothetical protein
VLPVSSGSALEALSATRSDVEGGSRQRSVPESRNRCIGDGDTLSHVLHVTHQPLDGLPAPHLHAPLQCTQVPDDVSLWIAHLELDEELQGGLVRLRFQRLKHLRPVGFEEVPPVTARFIGYAAVFKSVDDHTPGARQPTRKSGS